MRLLQIGLILSCALAASAQVCVNQPQSGLVYRENGKKVEAHEWACSGMTFDEAWSLLAAHGVPAIRPSKVRELGMRTNVRSRKHILITGLRIASFGLPFIPAMGAVSEAYIQTLLASGPALVEGGIRFAEGIPDDFTQTPSEGGYVTVYAQPTGHRILREALP